MSMGLGNNDGDSGFDPSGSSSQPAAAPAGWYPVDGGVQRYWDGAAWTDHMAPGAGGPTSQPQPGRPEFDPGSGVPGSGFPPGIGDPHLAHRSQPGPPFGQPSRPAPGVGGAMASTADDRTMGVLCHVLSLFTGFLGPLIVWLIKRDQSPFVDHHGKQALNFCISMLIYWMIAFISLFVLIGFILLPVLFVWGIVMPIVAAASANRGELYRYPLTIPFFG